MPEEAQPRVLSASCGDFRYFAALLRGVSFVNRAFVSITSGGLTVSVEEDRCLTATAFIFGHIFDEFIHQPDAARPPPSSQDPVLPVPVPEDDEERTTAFEIPLNTLLDCLSVFGSASLASSASAKKKKGAGDGHESDGGGAGAGGRRGRDKGKGRAADVGAGAGAADPAAGNARLEQWFAPAQKDAGMRLSYAGPGHPLTLFIVDEEGGPSATCEISTWDPDPRMELSFDSDAAVLKIILKSSWLRDALSELDPSTKTLTIIGNPPPPQGRAARHTPPRLRLRAVGQYGSTEMDYPNDREVLESCECPVPVSFSYRFKLIARALRAMQSSVKTSLRIDEEGLLSLQLMMPPTKRGGDKNTQAFVEFWCLPLDEDE